MAVKPIATEVLEEIRSSLGLETFNRPFAVMIDSGDFGTVFTYIPLFPGEYERLPLHLQHHAYCIDQGRYGLISFLPRSFELPRDGKVVSISTIYNEMGSLKSLTYKTDLEDIEYRVENTIRQEKLLAYAKKKKLPVRSLIRSSN